MPGCGASLCTTDTEIFADSLPWRVKFEFVAPMYQFGWYPSLILVILPVLMEALVGIKAVFCRETFHRLVVVCAESSVTTGLSEVTFTPGAVTFTSTEWMLLSSRISSTNSLGSILNSISD